MTTRIYGASDDLIEFEGDYRGEVGCYGTDEDGPVLLACSDGTIMEVAYCMKHPGVWGIRVKRKGELFESHTECDDDEADPYSDVVTMRDGLKWVMAGNGSAKVS